MTKPNTLASEAVMHCTALSRTIALALALALALAFFFGFAEAGKAACACGETAAHGTRNAAPSSVARTPFVAFAF